MERGVLHVKISMPIYATMLPLVAKIAPPTQQNNISIPFPIKVMLDGVNLKPLRKGDGTYIQITQIALDVSPKLLPSQDLINDNVKRGVHISIAMGNVKHDLFQAQNIHVSLTLHLQDLETFLYMQVSLDSPRVTAGFSSIDWSSIFYVSESNDNLQRKRVKMPFVNIASSSLFISYKGRIVGSKGTIAMSEYNGDSFTTSDDLSSYYSNIVLKQIPGFLTNVYILKTNVVHGTLVTAGKAALGATSLATSGASSIVGTALLDGVKIAIREGKSARNVATDDSYKVGDVSRGIVRGLSKATERGTQSRGSDGLDYIPGDFTVGAVKGIAEYGEIIKESSLQQAHLL